ncbi:sarcosine oxidase subunit alpha [candidate division MSBL1 archaeon SCGC-AAA259I09]|uniref:Sarcosine oxidase subunit alpha n=3 Tax=candidate division MSBL1 TaxID=215777 RepID=A0A133UT08_9EURY|nr:sarcosine oxidase subunit alpha [candidate division MSBL1 archaeon SCGC-AAA259B11]KXA93551.1 sarcosine oxidase subunit alpha [candidate division MSBL1 archaeon SCGC-AAA259E22]KXA97333.1 sarcosine oxidase subunit alpha [candidate division MSBL1 archaeon SCGC-AAA259I09]
MRIEDHPILSFDRGNKITFYYEDEPVEAYEGETIAAALFNKGLREFRKSCEKKRSRGFFCAIGKCSSCLMRVDGVPNVRTCVTMVKEEMEVEKQSGYPSIPNENGTESDVKQIEEEKTDILVIGGGPAGLKATLAAAEAGADVIIADENPFLGGQLIKQTHKFFGSVKGGAGKRGIEIKEELVDKVKNHEKVGVKVGTSAVGIYEDTVGLYKNLERFQKVQCDRVIVATGASEKMLNFKNNDMPGVYGAGGVQTLMNVYGIKPGDDLVMVGAGNVGLIVAYQLLQAKVNVKAIVEALDKIGGYYVHAAKIQRFGVPVLTGHTIKEVLGDNQVHKAVIAELDEEFNPIEGTEEKMDVDVVALAIGLSPDYKLLHQAGCELKYVPRLGGYVPLRDENMKTSRDDIYVAGDASGVEEATTAMLEGSIAGASAALSINRGGEEEKKIIKDAKDDLEQLRNSPYYEEIMKGLNEVMR